MIHIKEMLSGRSHPLWQVDRHWQGGVGGRWEEREEGRKRELRLVCEIKKIVFFKKKMLSIGVRMFDKFQW